MSKLSRSEYAAMVKSGEISADDDNRGFFGKSWDGIANIAKEDAPDIRKATLTTGFLYGVSEAYDAAGNALRNDGVEVASDVVANTTSNVAQDFFQEEVEERSGDAMAGFFGNMTSKVKIGG